MELHVSGFDRLSFDPTNVSLAGLIFSLLVIGVLGVLVMSAEYGTGTIRASLAAVPDDLSCWSRKRPSLQQWPLWWVKSFRLPPF